MLGQRQEQFMSMLPGLLIKAKQVAKDYGATIRGGDFFRDPRVHGAIGVKMGYGHKNSCHKLKLAQDINIVLNGNITLVGHNELHDYWDSVGGAERIEHDMNHYSLNWEDMR